MRVKEILVILLLVFSIETHAQKIMILGEETSRPLTWNDFKGNPDKGSPFFAYTAWTISFSVNPFTFKGDTVNWKVTVLYTFTDESWKKKDKTSDSLLKHEQDHFDIGKICAIELQSRINGTVFLKSDYQQKIRAMVMEAINKCRKMNDEYDKESNHGGNRDQQRKWDAFIAEELKKLQ